MSPVAPPSTGEPIRLAFVGQSTFFEACALPDGAAPGLRTTFVEFRAGGDIGRLLGDLAAFAPDVVLVFRPEIVPAGAFAALRATTLGFLTEPLPRAGADGSACHEDLESRLAELRAVDPANFDRVISFDPLIAATADEVLPVWRSTPLPVSDRYFAPLPAPATRAPRALFVGRSTEHRERLLVDAKHRHDILHVAFGAGADALGMLLGDHDVGINMHNEPYPSFENRVALHMAAGHLVVSEPLSPAHGLRAGVDHLVFTRTEDLTHMLTELERFPSMWHAVRVHGRLAAERFRASRVYPRLVGDLLADRAAFGSQRALPGP